MMASHHGAFASTDLEAQLRARGVTQVVVAGVATGTGVELTARQAYESGFNVTLATDAMTDRRAEAHAYSLTHVFPHLGESGTSEEKWTCCQPEVSDMFALDLVSYVFGDAVLANAVPHFVSGMIGRMFQSPFATPLGEVLLSSVVNVLWGSANLVIGYLLVCRVGVFDLRDTADIMALGIGLLLIAILMARHFGRFHGGDLLERS